jgi:formiminoglutamase
MSLPILISIPHGGTETPPEVAGRVRASAAEIFEDGDAFTPGIYDVAGQVAHVQVARVARAFVDLNRAEDDRPPANTDGVVKTATCFDRPIYDTPLDDALTETLLARYYRPYHAALSEAAHGAQLRLGLDCHSMAAVPPPVAPDADTPRPLFCLSNGEGSTCDNAVLERLAERMARAFTCAPEQVALNRPFKGGYITRRYGRQPLPWIQIEMNRSLYLAEPWFDAARRTIDERRLEELRGRFAGAIAAFANDAGWGTAP